MVRRRYTRSRSRPSAAIRLLIGAGLAGGAIGLGSVATTPEGRGQIIEAAEDFSVSAGLARERATVVGDHWRGCDDARAAGSAPLDRGEPGYRERSEERRVGKDGVRTWNSLGAAGDKKKNTKSG